jgi:hypothetical protein
MRGGQGAGLGYHLSSRWGLSLRRLKQKPK